MTSLAMANAFVCFVRYAGTVARGGRNALMHRYVTVRRHIYPSKVPHAVGDLTPIYMIVLTYINQLPNGISIDSAVFGQGLGVKLGFVKLVVKVRVRITVRVTVRQYCCFTVFSVLRQTCSRAVTEAISRLNCFAGLIISKYSNSFLCH